MRKGLGMWTYRRVVGSIVLASLTVLPSSVWAAPGEQQADRSKNKPQLQWQVGFRGRSAQAQPAVPASQPARNTVTAPVTATSTRPAVTPPRASTPQKGVIQNNRSPERVNPTPQVWPNTHRATPVDQERTSPPANPVATRSPRVNQNRPQSTVQEQNRPLPQPVREVRNTAPRNSEAIPVQPVTKARRLVVPEASFRGAGSETRVQSIPANNRTQAPAQWQSWVRKQNAQPSRMNETRRPVDIIGNAIPATASVVNRNTANYRRITGSFGAPKNTYVVAPGAVWGNGFFPNVRHHRPVVINFYYPFYYSDPDFWGRDYDGYYPSVYSYFGWAPGWI